MDAHDLTALRTGLAGSWNVEIAASSSEEDLLTRLADRVTWLIKNDYNRLLSSLYLLDVGEQRYREALESGGGESSTMRIAQLILEREIEKLESRRRYRRERSIEM